MANLTVRIPDDHLEEARQACAILDTTLSQVVRGALRAVVQRSRELERRRVLENFARADLRRGLPVGGAEVAPPAPVKLSRRQARKAKRSHG